jgi:hypothetical protein
MPIPGLIFILCGITSLLSAALLARAARGTSFRLLGWGAVFFVGMALNNFLLFADLVLTPGVNWTFVPHLVGLASLGVLIYALIWEAT